MKKWWGEVNEMYFRKPLKEELELIEPTPVIKLLNIFENDENKPSSESGFSKDFTFFFEINYKIGSVIENSTSGGKYKQENEVCD